MNVVKAKFNEIPADAFGIVILGCDLSTEENCNGFINGVTNHLIDHGVIAEGSKPEDVWSNVYSTTTTGGRADLIFVCIPEKFNVGRFAMERMGLPDCSWIEDWLVNYADHYDSEPRGPHADNRFMRQVGEDSSDL